MQQYYSNSQAPAPSSQFESTTAEELNILKDDVLKCLQKLFTQRGLESGSNCLGVNACELKAIATLLKQTRRKRIDLVLLKKTLIGKVISTVQERLGKFKSRLAQSPTTSGATAWVSREEAQLLEECSRETALLLGELKETYRREKEGVNASKSKPTNTPQGATTKAPVPKKEEMKQSELEQEKQKNECEHVEQPMPIQLAIEIEPSMIEKYKKKLNAETTSYRKSMQNRFFDILIKAEVYEDQLRFILGPQFAPIPGQSSDTKEVHRALVKKILDTAVKLEKALFQEKMDPKQYAEKARSLIFNLNNPKNPMLKLRLLVERTTPTSSKGKLGAAAEVFDIEPLSCENMVKAEAKELASREVQIERQNILKHDMAARRTDWTREQLLKKMDKDGKTGFFTCFKCGSKKTNFYQMQTRGADEPMTNFVNCLSCGKRWKC